MLKNKNILICVTGSIAAYKACEVVRLLRKEGSNVYVMMTKSAQNFIGVATFSALTNNEVITEMFPESPKAGLEHIELSLNLDLIVVVPATANIIGKVAQGVADEVVSTTLSVCEQPIIFVPAMNSRMWQNRATMDAVDKLRKRGKLVLDPESGQLASLHKGEGRLPDIYTIMNSIREIFTPGLPLKNKKVVVTAGPTRELIDPVRYISNRSSGKMGYSIAEVARDLGAEVILISGPVSLSPIPEISTIFIETAHEMLQEMNNIQNVDYLFMVAAVADYLPKEFSKHKIKRTKGNMVIDLVAAPDILKSITRTPNMKTIAFSLETENGELEAIRKMNEKGSDYIILNYANEEGAGFESNTNRVSIFKKDGNKKELELDRKDRIAAKIFDFILSENESDLK